MKAGLRVGLIGVDGFGATHLQALERLEAEASVRLVCVADPDVGRLTQTRNALEARGVRWHSDYRDLLELEVTLDAVAIAAPIHLHMEIAAAAIARGLFVYLEKPPVPLIQQLDELIALDFRQRVAVGFQLIYSPAVQQLKRWRSQGDLGEILSIRVDGSSPRSLDYYQRAPWAGKMVFDGLPVFDGPATNALSHWLHNIMYLGAANADEFDVPVEVEAELYRVKPIESYDVISMRGRLVSGAKFEYMVTHASETAVPCRLELVGSRGRAWIDENEASAASDLGLPVSTPTQINPFLESWRDFIRFALGETPGTATRLEDTHGYVLATNGALMSSGGIRELSAMSESAGGKGTTIQVENLQFLKLSELIQ